MKNSYRPKYHASVPSGWANDPNGTIFYNGKAHLFFQHYPHKPEWGTMHWGHFTTTDFVHWTTLPVALVPDQDYEVLCGCCSGSAIEKDGKLYLIYTAAQPELQRQCLAFSEDGGVTFVKRQDNPILTAGMLSEEVSELDFRDPHLFMKDGLYYFVAGARWIDPATRRAGLHAAAAAADAGVQTAADADAQVAADAGAQADRAAKRPVSLSSSSIRFNPSAWEHFRKISGTDAAVETDAEGRPVSSPSDVFGDPEEPEREGYGNLILCKSRDLLHWEYVGHLLYRQPEYEDDFYVLNGVYECPDYIVLDGKEIVLSSPQNLPQMGNRYQNVHSGLYMVGELDFDTGHFRVDKIGELDNGFDFYAAQTLRMPDGRVIMIAWKEMWDRNYPTQAEGWAGTYSFPREFRMDGDQLIQRPARELDAFCKNRVCCPELTVSGGACTGDESADVSANKDSSLCHAEGSTAPAAPGTASVQGMGGNVARIRFTLEPGTATKAGIKVFCGKEHETAVYYDRNEGVVVIDRTISGIPFKGSEDSVNVRKCDIGDKTELEFELLLDVSSLEVFIDGGRHVMTANVYPDPEDTEVRFFAEGGTAVFKKIEKFDVVV